MKLLIKADRDLEAITEYMYGAIPLSYKGMTTKMHLIPMSNQDTKALLFTRLFTVRGLDDGQWTGGGSLSSSWGSNASSSSTGGALAPSGFPFPKMTPIKKDPPSPNRPVSPTIERPPPPPPPQKQQTPAERFTSGWFPSPSPILTRGPLQKRAPFKSPSPDNPRRDRRIRGTTMFALGVIVPVSTDEDLRALIHGDSYGTLRRAIEELVRDVHERLEGGEYRVDFGDDVERFLIRLRDGLGVLRKVPLAWRGSDNTWREIVLSMLQELDPKYIPYLMLISFLNTLMSNILAILSNRLNTPPTSPLHPSSPIASPPPRLLILSSSAPLANRLTVMLLPFFRIVYPPSRHPKKVLPNPPKLQILPPRPRSDSSHSSVGSRSRDSRNVDLPRRATHPSLYQRRDTFKSPPQLSISQTPGGGNPSSVSSWFGSWIRRGGPLAASGPSPGLSDICSSYSPRATDFTANVLRESDTDIPPPEIDVVKDPTGEVVDVKLATSFLNCRRRSSVSFPEEYDLKRRGSMTLNNVAFMDDMFRVTGFHGCRYHVDYHLQSMENTDEVEQDVFRVLKEDILYFFAPPVHAMPLNPRLSPEIPRLHGPRTVTCIIADLDTWEVRKLSVQIQDDEERHRRETLTPKDDRQWQRIQEWAMDGYVSVENIIKEVLA
jgi:hypothetical protein